MLNVIATSISVSEALCQLCLYCGSCAFFLKKVTLHWATAPCYLCNEPVSSWHEKWVSFLLGLLAHAFFWRGGVGRNSLPKWQWECRFGWLKYFKVVSGAGNITTSYYLTLNCILVLCYHYSIFCDTNNQKIHFWSLNMRWCEHMLCIVGYTQIFPYCWSFYF